LPSLWKNETMEASRIKGSILKYGVPPLWPSYIGERRTTFAKTYGIKVRCYWELFEEHIWNLGTVCFEPTPMTREHSMTRLLIGCMEIIFLKLAGTSFGLN